MKLVINEKYIKKYKTIGNYATISSLLILVLGLVFAFSKDMTRILYSYVALVVGFVLTQVGMYFVNRFGRNPRYDEVLTTAFEKLRHDYTFYVFSAPVPLLLSGPCGLWIVTPITATGTISYEDGKWKQRGSNALLRFMGQEGIGNPDKDLQEKEDNLRKYLSTHGIPADQQPPVKQVMVVMLKKTQVGEVSKAAVPIVELEEVKRFIRRVDREECATPLSPDAQARINTVLQTGQSAPQTLEGFEADKS